MEGKDILKVVKGMEDFEPTSDKVIMKDGTTLEESMTSLKSEVLGAKGAMIESSKKLIDLL